MPAPEFTTKDFDIKELQCKNNKFEYSSWCNMIQRCTNPNHAKYKHYGGRGITVCARWRAFANFLLDMGHKPTPKHSIDRINNDGNYEPGNCRWATQSEQMRKMGRDRQITFNGETMSTMQWATRLGLKYTTLYNRLRNWPIERALSPKNVDNVGKHIHAM